MGAFNGSGTFVRTYDWSDDAANAIKIRSDRMDTEDDGFATGLSNTICRDGQSTTTARIPFAVGIGLSAGSVSAPSIAATGDTNTGWYWPAADTIALSIGGSKVLQSDGTTALAVTGVATISSTLAVTGAATLSSTLAVTGSSTFTGSVIFEHAGFVLTGSNSGFEIGSESESNTPFIDFHSSGNDNDYDSRLLASGGALADGGGTLTFTGATFAIGSALTVGTTAGITGNLSVNTNKFTVTAASGNTAVAGTLGVTGAATLSSTLAVTGATTLSSTLAVTGAATLSSSLSVEGNTTLGNASGDSVTINAATVSVPNGLNFDSNTLVIDATNNRVGFGTSSPSAPVHVSVTSGQSAFFKGTDGNSDTYISLENDAQTWNLGVDGGNSDRFYLYNGSSHVLTVSTSGALATTGNITTTAGGLFATMANAGIELGASGSSNTPFIDFHSSSSSTDYDVRLIASGGTASDGAGTLTINAAVINGSGSVYQVSGTQVLGSRKTGWTNFASGTATRDLSGITTGSATASTCAQVLNALLADLISHGVIGS